MFLIKELYLKFQKMKAFFSENRGYKKC